MKKFARFQKWTNKDLPTLHAENTPVLIVIVSAIEHWYIDQILGELDVSGFEEGAAYPFLNDTDQILVVAVEFICYGSHGAADAAPEVRGDWDKVHGHLLVDAGGVAVKLFEDGGGEGEGLGPAQLVDVDDEVVEGLVGD